MSLATLSVTERVSYIRERLEAAARQVGRDPSTLTLVGASKVQPLAVLREAFDAGLRIFGENRVQEAAEKAPELPAEVEWHLIGPLQSNKAKRAVDLFHTVHSVDRVRIAEALSRHASSRGRRLPCFLEVNLGAETSKHGFLPESLGEATARIGELAGIELVGLMAIPPRETETAAARGWFSQLARLRDGVARTLGPAFRGYLSMGMSDDFELAIQEGATHVRIGSALFGERVG